MNFGSMFDKTEMTPKPPKDKIGIIWSSFPEYMCKLSWHKAAILAICEILPEASLIATIFSILDNSKQVSGLILTPVLLGTLYKIIGRVTSFAMAV